MITNETFHTVKRRLEISLKRQQRDDVSQLCGGVNDVLAFWPTGFGKSARLALSSPVTEALWVTSLICRILGAHKPHRHAKAVPHRWGTSDSCTYKKYSVLNICTGSALNYIVTHTYATLRLSSS